MSLKKRLFLNIKVVKKDNNSKLLKLDDDIFAFACNRYSFS